MMDSAGPIAECEAVTKAYRGRLALANVTLSIAQGEAVGLVGGNGAGKTTLLSLLSGLRRPTEGTVRVFGGDPTNARHRTRMGVSPQALSLPETAKVREVIRFVRDFYARPLDDRSLIDDFGLGPLLARQIGGLSGGQKRLLSVALAFAGDPMLVLLDEPTTGLDTESRELLWLRVSQRIEQGATVMLFAGLGFGAVWAVVGASLGFLVVHWHVAGGLRGMPYLVVTTGVLWGVYALSGLLGAAAAHIGHNLTFELFQPQVRRCPSEVPPVPSSEVW